MKAGNRASDLKLRHVGNRLINKLSYRSEEHHVSGFDRKPSGFADEADLQDFCGGEECQQSQNSLPKYSAIEDTRVSRFTYQQILLLQKNLLVLTLLVIFFGMIKIEADVAYPSGEISSKVMRIISACIIILIMLVTLRKILIQQLHIDQRNVYVPLANRKDCKSSFLMLLNDSKLLLELISQVLIILPHPNCPMQGVTYTQYDQNQQAEFVYSLNDLLSVLMMAKIYLVFRSLVALTVYSSPRAIRLCSYNHVEHGFFFSIKCIQHEYPLACTLVVFAFTTVIFGLGFRVSEGTLYYLNTAILGEKRGFEDYGNCIWYTFITMTSIGYGQYSPITPVGRLLASIISIFGVVLNSFLVVALTEYLKMKSAQNRSHTTLQRLIQQRRLYDDSTGVLSETIQVTQLLSTHKLDPLILKRMKPVFEDLKKKIDSTKAKTRTIKAILPQENKTELMIHQFQLVKDYFRQFYNKQRKIKQKIEKIEMLRGNHIEQVRQSFMNSMQFALQRP